MAVAEIVTTKKECYTIFENGYIHMERGKYVPTKAPLHDVYSRPKKPEAGLTDLVEHNIWGEEIYRAMHEAVSQFKRVSEGKGFKILDTDDFSRLVVEVEGDGEVAAKYLEEKGIYPEMVYGSKIVFIVTPFNAKNLNLLGEALSNAPCKQKREEFALPQREKLYH